VTEENRAVNLFKTQQSGTTVLLIQARRRH